MMMPPSPICSFMERKQSNLYLVNICFVLWGFFCFFVRFFAIEQSVYDSTAKCVLSENVLADVWAWTPGISQDLLTRQARAVHPECGHTGRVSCPYSLPYSP